MNIFYFCNRGLYHSLTANKCLSYFDSFKPSIFCLVGQTIVETEGEVWMQ